MIIRTRSYSRAGLVGNPSDGFFGKTISVIIRNFWAEITLYESPDLEIMPSHRDHSQFASLEHLVDDVRNFGYYGGVRLIKATLKKFHDYCSSQDLKLVGRNYTIRYQSTIPELVGMAGSSAIVTATMRALMHFYGVQIPKVVLPSLCLSVEREELNIPAGLQDRVIQVYEGLVYMDFQREGVEANGHGIYEELDTRLLPPLYLAYKEEFSEGTEVLHSDLRGRYNAGDPEVIQAMKTWAGLAEETRQRLSQGQKEIGDLLDANFDLRRKVCKISRRNLEMVDAARAVGASAKFTGSGGAIVGTYKDEEMFGRLQQAMDEIGIKVIKPFI